MTKEAISEIFINICKIHIDDGINFEFSGIDNICEDD